MMSWTELGRGKIPSCKLKWNWWIRRTLWLSKKSLSTYKKSWNQTSYLATLSEIYENFTNINFADFTDSSQFSDSSVLSKYLKILSFFGRHLLPDFYFEFAIGPFNEWKAISWKT